VKSDELLKFDLINNTTGQKKKQTKISICISTYDFKLKEERKK